jgi:hypothetical protein
MTEQAYDDMLKTIDEAEALNVNLAIEEIEDPETEEKVA